MRKGIKKRPKSGWYNHPYAHSLASRGIRTRSKNPRGSYIPDDNILISFEPSCGMYYWAVFRDSGTLFDEGHIDTKVEAEILAKRNIKEMYEEEIPRAYSRGTYQLTEIAPYRSVADFMRTNDMNREDANRYIRKWHPMWIDYEHSKSIERLKKMNKWR